MIKVRANKKFIICTLMAITAILIIGPLDVFTHGFYYNEISPEQILSEDFFGTIDLEKDSYEMIFCPQKPHFAGFEIYLLNQPDDNTGTLHLSIESEDGKIIENVYIDLSTVHEASWYKVYTSANYKKGEKYILKFIAEDCTIVPHLQRVNQSYLADESVMGDILLVYAYANSTFSFQNKVIIALLIIAIWACVCSKFTESKIKKPLCIAGIGIFLTAALTWNYMYNSMDDQNSKFPQFQADSETLVTGTIYAVQDGTWFRNQDEMGFGLGRYYDLKGVFKKYGLSYLTDTNWLNGYSRSEGALIVNSNDYSKSVVVEGNYISFNNGELFRIVKRKKAGDNLVIYLNTNNVLSPAKYGSLDDITFYNKNLKVLKKSLITAYKSQYGLQGKLFRRLARYIEEEQTVEDLHLLCSLATASVFVLIVFLISQKYNNVMAGVFLITFWLSPWIVNFARNLYWLEFTWFIPMGLGLFCCWKIEKRSCRSASYVLIFIAIFVKCLCGYEYISTIMMGMIAFPLVDLALAVANKNKPQIILLFRTIFIMGIISICAFMAAICVHASLRGGGDVISGIKFILEQDVLRRTGGGDMNDFDTIYWASFNASVWETIKKYFHFSTEIITGITGNLFPLLCIVPLCIFTYEYYTKKLNIELIAMYLIFFFSSISWFCLAKGHSYIHTHMNYVLWYFGFVQICLYVIVNKFLESYKNCFPKKKKRKFETADFYIENQ